MAAGICIANRTKARVTTLAEQLRSAVADGEDCSKFRPAEAVDGTSSATEQL